MTQIATGGSRTIVSKTNSAAYANLTSSVDKAAVDAHIGAQLFYDFLRTVTSAENGQTLVSISDPATAPMAAMISAVDVPLTAGTEARAFFDFGVPNSVVGYPRTGGLFASAALDIVGHEWWHAFTALTMTRDQVRVIGPGLCEIRGCESKAAAVEEAFADSVGESFETTFANAGRIPGKSASNFTVGEDLDTTSIRNLANPRASDRPDHVQHSLFQERCSPDLPIESSAGAGSGVAIDPLCGGPFQKANFLLASTGTQSFPLTMDRNAGGGYLPQVAPTVSVTGLGVPIFVRIAFRANQVFWQSGRNYKHYAVGMVRAAESLGLNAGEVQRVINAYDAVGLLPGRITNIGTVASPAGAGTVTLSSAVVFQDDAIQVRATSAQGRTFKEFVLRFTNGNVRTLPPRNPAVVGAEPGLIIEARFE